MITDKHLFSELIYIGPKALVALKDAIHCMPESPALKDKDGRIRSSTELLADALIELADTAHLRVAVIEQTRLGPSEEYVLNDQWILHPNGYVDPAKRAELIKKLSGRACIYATAIKGNEAIQKGGRPMNAHINSLRDLPWGETTVYGQSLIENVLKRYPRGKAPLTSIELCKAWLLCNEPENSDRSRKLDAIEIDANDQTWSLDGEPQGDSVDLCCWVFRRERTSSTEKTQSAIIRIWYASGVRRSRRAAWKERSSNRPVGRGTRDLPSETSPRSTPVVARHNTDKCPDPEPSHTIRPVAGCTEKPPTDTRLILPR